MITLVVNVFAGPLVPVFPVGVFAFVPVFPVGTFAEGFGAEGLLTFGPVPFFVPPFDIVNLLLSDLASAQRSA